MRQIGTIPDADDARRLADHLLTLGITSRIDDRPGGNQVWIHREDQVEAARGELEAFLKDPGDPRYQGVSQSAKALRKKKQQEDRKHVRNSISLRGGWDYRPPERVPLTLLLIAASVLVAVVTELGQKPGKLTGWLWIAPSVEVVVDDDGEFEVPEGTNPRVLTGHRVFVETEDLHRVRQGEIWRLVTPIFLHFGILHLLFNMFWLNDLGGMVEIRKGFATFAGIVLATAIVSNLAQYAHAGPRFGGMSGVIFGLFGYVWILNRYDPSAGLPMRPNTEIIMGIGFVLGMAHAFGPVANVAHLAGLATGLAIGGASLGWKRLRRRRA